MQTIPESAMLRLFPPGARILEVASYRPGYLPYPAQVAVETAGGSVERCVVKIGEQPGVLAHEARVLRALAELGLPVPRVLCGPTALPEEGATAVVLSELPGMPLPWLGLTDLNEAHLTCELLRNGIDALHELTGAMARHEVGAALPRLTLTSELAAIMKRGGPWLDVPLYGEAVQWLQSALPRIETPLVFSNGDYNPLNFLHTEGTLTGWLDFENACFEDPYIGFAKFMLWTSDDYGWGAGAKAGLVQRFLYAHDVDRSAFAPRLALRCLRDLQERGDANPVGKSAMHDSILKMLADCVHRSKH
jgi:aminoglycoside phosphotransferase (APT) family kinase protein